MLSTVIPVYNEVDSLETLHAELDAVARAENYQLDIIFVDDGSKDGSWQTIRKLAAKDSRVRGLKFRRNFGKAPALSAGFRAARGELVMTLDADLQDDPREIPRFLAKMAEGVDVVSGWKRVRHDPWHKVLLLRVFNGMVSWLTDVPLHDHNCGMKCYRREIFREVRLYGELHRFVPVLAAARGFRVGEIEINHRARKFGYSKYGFRRFVKGFLDLLTVKFLTGFGQRPQHMLGAIGLVSFSIGLVGLTYLACYWIAAQLFPEWHLLPLHDRPAVLYSLGALLLGGQLMSIGFLAELITAYQGKDESTYSISERTEAESAPVEVNVGSGEGAVTNAPRFSLATVLIVIAAAALCSRIMAVDSIDRYALEHHLYRQGRQDWQQARPFLSANDRSRWATVRALVEHGTYAIDDVVAERGWDTIDMVQHRGRDGELHLYSSKPPLLATLLAGFYWVIVNTTGATLGTHPYEVGRTLLVIVNLLPLVAYLVLLNRMAERFTTNEWSRSFLVAAAAFGTFITTFSVSLNNHTLAAVCVAALLAAMLPIWYDGRRELRDLFAAGLWAALAAACELPALALTGLAGLALLWKAPKQTLLAGAPAAVLVAVAALGTNYIAHGEFRPAYSHRTVTADGLIESDEDWYLFTYVRDGKPRQSYWHDPVGVDRGEPSVARYLWHCTFGHHGIFSLTPIWLLSLVGLALWLRDPDRRALAAMIAVVSVVCFVFYMTRPPLDRNYGGVTSGLRWMFWFAPLWLVGLLPAVDKLSTSRWGRGLALALLAVSVFSATYPTWNPWTPPWLENLVERFGI